MKRLFAWVSLALAASAFGFAAPASSPSFSSAQGSIDRAESLVVSFKEVNLPPSSQVSYSLQDVSTVTYGCVSNSDKHMVLSTTSIASSKSQAVTLMADSQGKVVGAISNDFADAPSTFSCSPGSTKQALRLGYSNILFQDVTNDITSGLSGPCATTCSDALKTN